MVRILMLVCLFVTVQGTHKHHPKFPRDVEELDKRFEKVGCLSQHDQERNDLIEESKCGAPRPIFYHLEYSGSHLQVSPSAVWVKQCVGLCNYDTFGSKCVAIRKHVKHVPVRVFNVRTNKESCVTYPVEEHLECGCCSGSAEHCAAPKVYDPRKCACRCPNRQEKRACRSQPNQIMRWNPSKCICEEKIRVRKTKHS